MLESKIFTVPMAGPDDASGVARLFESGTVNPKDIVGVIAQTEGDGYARGYAALALQLLLQERIGLSRSEIFDRIPMLMIGGTAGMMCPHITLFLKHAPKAKGKPGVKRMTLGVSSTRRLLPEEYGTLVEVELVADAVKVAMADAGLKNPADVASVQMKTPSMTPARIADAVSRGKMVCDSNPAIASGMTRGAAALGAAVALGELSRSKLSDSVIGRDTSVYSDRACASAGGEQVAVRIVVIGNADGAPGTQIASSGMMQHQLDLAGARLAFQGAGLAISDGVVAEPDRTRLRAVFVKAGADAVSDIGGRRHTMKSDFLNSFSGHQAKAVCHAIVSSIAGDTLVLANAGPEHQGKPGSNMICVIADADGINT